MHVPLHLPEREVECDWASQHVEPFVCDAHPWPALGSCPTFDNALERRLNDLSSSYMFMGPPMIQASRIVYSRELLAVEEKGSGYFVLAIFGQSQFWPDPQRARAGDNAT